MPMLGATATGTPAVIIGSPKAASMRSRDLHRLVGAGDVLEQHAELVAGQAGRVSALRTQLRRRAATSTSSASPRGVAERVVDRLEVVEVDEEQRHEPVVALAASACSMRS